MTFEDDIRKIAGEESRKAVQSEKTGGDIKKNRDDIAAQGAKFAEYEKKLRELEDKLKGKQEKSVPGASPPASPPAAGAGTDNKGRSRLQALGEGVHKSIQKSDPKNAGTWLGCGLVLLAMLILGCAGCGVGVTYWFSTRNLQQQVQPEDKQPAPAAKSLEQRVKEEEGRVAPVKKGG